MLKQNEMPTGAPKEETKIPPHGGRRRTPRHPHLTLYPFSSSYTVYNKIEECEPPLTYEANTQLSYKGQGPGPLKI